MSERTPVCKSRLSLKTELAPDQSTTNSTHCALTCRQQGLLPAGSRTGTHPPAGVPGVAGARMGALFTSSPCPCPHPHPQIEVWVHTCACDRARTRGCMHRCTRLSVVWPKLCTVRNSQSVISKDLPDDESVEIDWAALDSDEEED